MKAAMVATALVLGSSLAGCGDPNEPVVGEATPEPMQSPVGDRCEEPAEEILGLLHDGIDVRAELEHPRLVASGEDDELVFVAVELVGDALDEKPPIGTWAIVGGGNDREIYSVSAVARYHSSWPDGTRQVDPITMATDGAEEVERCVDAAAE